MNEIETYEALSRGEKVSRKEKLLWIGRKLSKKKLREKIKTWQSKPDHKKIISYFCPHCGCGVGFIYDRNINNPGDQVNEYCLRCHELIAWKDNSPWKLTLSFFNIIP